MFGWLTDNELLTPNELLVKELAKQHRKMLRKYGRAVRAGYVYTASTLWDSMKQLEREIARLDNDDS